MMTWDRVHRRHELVHAVLDDIARTGRPTVPARFRAEVDAEFGDFGAFLCDVQHRWHRAFDARLDALLEDEPDDLPEAIATMWCSLADVLPAARLLLDTYAEHPALAAADEHHRRALHRATGVYLDQRMPRRPARRQIVGPCGRVVVLRASTA